MRERTQKWQEFSVHRVPDHQCTLVTLEHSDLRSPIIVRALEHDFEALVPQLRTSRVVVDFAQVTVAPTALFGVVLKFVVDCRDTKIQVRLCGLASPIRKAFDLLNAKGLVDVYASRRDAVTATWKKRGWWPFS